MKDEWWMFTARARLYAAAAILFSSFILHPSSLCFADSIWIGPPTAPPLIKDVRITRMDGEKVYFDVSGRETSREIEKITRLSVDSEPTLTAAEDALMTDKLDAAVDNYQKVIRANITAASAPPSPTGAPNPKAWTVIWASRRLQQTAQKTGRFDASVAAFIARVQLENASTVPRPQLPDEKSTYLDTAATNITAALSSNDKLTDAQRAALLGFLVDVQRARRDTKAADAAAEKLDEILAKDPNNPQAARALARRRLQIAQAALDRRDFKQVITEIEQNRAQFTDPLQQSDALFLLAEAKLQSAVAARQQGSADPNALKDAALGYMRIVAHFKDAPDRPHVVQALLRTAQIHELLGDRATAIKLYEQIATQYPDDPNTASAKQSLERLRQQAPTGTEPATTQSAGANR